MWSWSLLISTVLVSAIWWQDYDGLPYSALPDLGMCLRFYYKLQAVSYYKA